MARAPRGDVCNEDDNEMAVTSGYNINMGSGYIQAMKKFAVDRPWTTGILALIIVGGCWWYYSSTHKQTKLDFAVVARGTVSQVVSVTGKVTPASDVQLSFDKGGRIAYVYHDVGERVYEGTALVTLENGDIVAQLAQARANVKAQQAKLQELKNGARPEDILVSQVDVKNAQNDVTNDVKNAYVNADDAIRNKVDQLFSNPKGASPQFNFIIGDSQLKSDLETGRPTIETMLVAWNSSIAGVNQADDLGLHITSAKNHLATIQGYLDRVALAVNTLSTGSSLTQSTIDGYKAAILSGRTNVTGALDSLTASEEKLSSAQSKLALKEAGTVREQIDAQQAQVDAASASADNLAAQLAKTIIRSPISGIVTKQDAKAGETATAGTPLVSVISDATYEIEAFIPEADIAKIKIGDAAQVTLDAYGNDVVFSAMVAKIDPAETIVEGVSTYKTTLQFKENDTRIKSGMTANTDISGDKHENVLAIPGRAITTSGTAKTVNVIEGNAVHEISVTTGLRGSNGDVEIVCHRAVNEHLLVF